MRDYYAAYEGQASGFGLLPTELPNLPAGSRFDDVATPPMRAVRNLARAFAGSVALERSDPLGVEVASLGPESKVFEGDAAHPPLWHREVLAVLPFQITPRRHAVAVYVMTRDAVRPLPPATFRLTFSGVKGSRVEAVDVMSGEPLDVRAEPLAADRLDVVLPVTEKPVVLTIGP
mgnify:CR=1 FL=1